MSTTTLFDLPTSPEEFGVLLPPSELRRFDFSGLDYDTARRATIEYIKTYWPDQFNDFVASNGIMMLVEIVSAVVAKLALRGDILANSAFIGTAKSERAIVNHLALINQRIRRQTPAVTDVEISIDQPVSTDIEIVPGLLFSTRGSDQQSITYEIYRSPNDWTSNITIPASKRGIIAWGVEGQFASPVTVTSAGGPSQRFTISEPNILESPIFVTITVGNDTEDWVVITEPIERYGPNDKVVEVNFFEDSAVFQFGNDINGKSPLSGSTITFRYRVGGGIRGRIGVGQINSSRPINPLPPANAAVSVSFINISPSNGGTDKESIENAKRRAPRDYATQRSIVTAEDYAQVAANFSHPVFGSVAKAIATIRTGYNANRVEIYCLVEGPDSIPMIPNAGLKAGLQTYFTDLNVLTDHVVILDGVLKPVNIDVNIIVNKNADASVVKDRVEAAITGFFSINNWELGEPFYLSNFIEIIEAIDGVAYVDFYSPSDNILPSGQIGDSSSDMIGFNELIIEGTRKTNYFYENASYGAKR